MYFITSIVFIIFSKFCFAHTANCGSLLKPTAVKIENEIEAALDKVTAGDTVIIPDGSSLHGYRIIRSLNIEDRSAQALTGADNFIAEFSFTINPYEADGLVLTIEHSKVAPQYRKLGIYKLLFAQALKAYPNIKQIDALLIDTNVERFQKFYRMVSWKDRLFSHKLAVLYALTHTPAYKIRETFGFTRIVKYKVMETALSFSVVRD